MFKAGDTIKIDKEVVLKVGDTGLFLIGGGAFSEKELLALGAVKVRKSYTERELDEKFGELNNVHLQALTFKALNIMQQDNSRPIANCIYMAMGYRNDHGKRDTWHKVGEE